MSLIAMKKIILLAFCFLAFSPLAVRAETILTPEERASLIADIRAQLIVLYQELIQQLIAQMNTNTDRVVEAIHSSGSSNTVVQLPQQPVAQVTAPVQKTMEVSLNKVCVSGKTAYKLVHSEPYYKGGVKGTATMPDGTTSDINWAWDNRGAVMDDSVYTPTLGGDDFVLGTVIDYTFSLKDNAGTEVGSLSGSLTVESCE